MSSIKKNSFKKKITKVGYATFILGILGTLSFIMYIPNMEQPYSTFTEADFFEMLDGTNPELASIKVVARTGNYTKAKILLKTYFLNKPADSNFNNTYLNLINVISSANLAIERTFTQVSVTKTLSTYPESATITINGRVRPNTNWHNNPFPEDHEWIWQLSRGGWMLDLARGYDTNNRLGNVESAKYYAEWCVDSLTDFIQKEPVGTGFTWRTIDSGLRAPKLLGIFEMLKTSDAFTSDFCFLFLRFILDHGKYLHDFHKTQFNWAFIESTALLKISAFLPEFTIISQWQTESWNAIEFAIAKTFYPDGGTREQAMNYHGVALGRMGDVLLMAKDYAHISIPITIKSQLENAYVFNLQNMMPDGLTTSFGDSRRSNRISISEEGVRMFPTNKELAFINPENGNPVFTNSPPSLNYYFSDSGHLISRSAWNHSTDFDSNALFSFFDGGEFGDFYHQHNDFGSVQLYGFNRTFLIDPGIVDYSMDEKTNYYRSSHAHNVIHVDGIAQNGIIPVENELYAGYLGSYASATHTQYGTPLERRFQFVNFRTNLNDPQLVSTSSNSDANRYWIVSDFWRHPEWLTLCLPHEATMLWHLPNASMISIDNSSIDLNSGGTQQANIYCKKTSYTSGNIGIYGFGPWDRVDTIIGGSSSVHGQPYGWRNDNLVYGQEEASTTLRYTGSFCGPKSWFTVLYPAEGEPNIKVKTIPFKMAQPYGLNDEVYSNMESASKIGNVFAVETSQGKDLHVSLMNPTENGLPLKLSFLGHQIEFEGKHISLHFDNSNQLTQISTKHSVKLTINANNLLSYNGNVLAISGVNNLKALTFSHPEQSSISSISINARVVPATLYSISNNAVNLGSTILGGGF